MMQKLETLEDVKFAIMRLPSYDTHFEVTKVTPKIYSIRCTHGAWSCQVDRFGRAYQDNHFKHGQQMVSHSVTESELRTYPKDGEDV